MTLEVKWNEKERKYTPTITDSMLFMNTVVTIVHSTCNFQIVIIHTFLATWAATQSQLISMTQSHLVLVHCTQSH